MQNNKNRVAIFIDGSNLFHKLKDLQIPNTLNFDYIGLCHKLARKKEIISCRYYVGAIRAKDNDTKGQKLRANQLKLFNKLNGQGFMIKKGNFLFNGAAFTKKVLMLKWRLIYWLEPMIISGTPQLLFLRTQI